MRVLLMVVIAVMTTACAATGARPQPFPAGRSAAEAGGPTRPDGAVGTTGTPSGYEVSGTALDLRGTPYRNGGMDPNGFDCSGFVWYVFTRHGLSLPRTVEDQWRVGGTVEASDLQPGDLVFFTTTSPGASHVGIVIGGDSFIHAPSSSGVVRVERLGASYWSSRYVGAKRVLQAF